MRLCLCLLFLCWALLFQDVICLKSTSFRIWARHPPRALELHAKEVNKVTTRYKVDKIGDKDFEDLLSGDAATARPAAAPAETERKESVLSQKLTTALTMLAKCTSTQLRDLIVKLDSNNPNVDKNTDFESLCQSALDASWTKAQDWDILINMLEKEIGQYASTATEYMKSAVVEGDKLSEKRIKDLITKFGTSNDIPKINRSKYVGKLLKTDYLAVLVDLLREQNGNDYKVVYEIIQSEVSSHGYTEEKRGFK